MKFGRQAVGDAVGGLLAHAVKGPDFAFRKGRRLSTNDVERLAAAGIAEVTVARLDASDIGEDDAAGRIATALAGDGLRIATPFTGRCNLYAAAAGVVVIDAARIAAVNAVSETITVATLPPFARADAGDMVATVKIIPFAAPRSAVAQAVLLAHGDAQREGPALRCAAFRPQRTALIQTTLPGQKATLVLKTQSIMAARLADLGSALGASVAVPHRTEDLAAALGTLPASDLILIVGTSAIVDRRDVIPAAITAAGGAIDRFGMPVEPGNLLLLGRLGSASVVGLPGCARSPKLNGFDWVLERLCAGLSVDAAGIAAMGVGGLLVASRERRPRLRASDHGSAPAGRVPVVAAIVLAAGRGTRFGSAPKLASAYRGEAMLRHAIKAALGAEARPVIVVLGHAAATLKPLIADLPVVVVDNPDYHAGLATSLAAGLAAVPARVEAAAVLLADMPRVTAAHLSRLIAAFDPKEGRSVCVPTFRGQRGNPVLWAREMFVEMAKLTGDQGGRVLLDRFADAVCEVEMGDDGVLFDVDEPDSLVAPSLAG